MDSEPLTWIQVIGVAACWIIGAGMILGVMALLIREPMPPGAGDAPGEDFCWPPK
jgi:hypothetical protein